MTSQEIFDTVRDHLLKQGVKSQTDLGGPVQCMYRGPGGLKCAVGCLITDEEYLPEMEGTDIDKLDLEFFNLEHLGSYMYLIADLQDCHDHYEPSSWAKRLQEIAEHHGLKSPVVSTQAPESPQVDMSDDYDPTPEPDPQPGHGDIWAEVIESLERGERVLQAARARREFGLQKYGTVLQYGNGRDFLKDAQDEALDLLAYSHALRDTHPGLTDQVNQVLATLFSK